MIVFDSVHKQYAHQVVLDSASFTVNPGERMGIVGPNGAGKSTIFRLITGEEEVDKGEVIVPNGLRVGHLRQQLPSTESDPALLDYVLEGGRDLLDMEEEIHRLQDSLTETTDEARMAELGDLQHEFERRDGYRVAARAEAALGGLGFAEARFTEPISSFSGGWQMRAQLARVLLAAPDILLLDEPSNYLDLPAVEWLQRHLESFQGTLLLISHDRHLLRTLARQILDIRRGAATRYAMEFDRYVEEREHRMEQQEARWKTLHKQREDMETFIRRFRAQANKAAQVQSRIKMLEKMEPLPDIQRDTTATLLRLPPPPPSGHELLRLEGLGHRYGEDPWIFRDVDLRVERGDRLALVGYNGMGKTTLLKIMAGVMPPAEGKRVEGHQLVTGYQSQEFAETLPAERQVFSVVKDAAPAGSTDQGIRTLLGSFGFQGDDVHKQVEVLSGGEKIRLAFARIFVNPPNLLLLDEPTTHLDLAGREALEKALRNYGGTVCLVSHDVSFVRGAANGILSIGPEGVRRWLGGYDDFLEQSRGQVASGGKPPPKSEKKSTAKPDGKRRKDIRRELRQLQNRMQKLEGVIEEKETAKQAALDRAGRGEITDFAAHRKSLNQLAGDIQQATREWIEIGEQVENLETELADV